MAADPVPSRRRYVLPEFSVGRPVTVVMILLALLVVGAIAYLRIPISLFPEGMEERALGVVVPYPNAAPRDIEEKIARPVEDMIGTMSGVRRVRTFINPGSMFARIEFQSGTDLRLAYATLRDRMDRVLPELPDDVDRIYLRRWDQNDIPIIYLVAALPPGMDDAWSRLDTVVRPAFQRIEGVGNVEMWGLQAREIRIELDDARVRSHGVDLVALVGRLRSENLDMAGGTVLEGGRRIYVRSLGRFRSAEEIAGLIIDPARRLRLADIATVDVRPPRREWVYRVEGQPTIGIEITRESSGNIDQISRRVRAVLQEVEAEPALAGVRFSIFWDQGVHVRESIQNLRSSGLWGGLFAALILFYFLRAPRLTGILTLAIPLSLLVTVVCLYFAGWSLNMATMMGLLLSVGLVVDNSIVIVENIHRLRQEGLPARDACVRGAGEVGLAVILATLTTVVVFLPLILMSDEEEFSFWMLRIGLPVVTSLLASLFIAMIFVPLAAMHLSRGTRHEEPGLLRRARELYVRALRWTLAHRLEAGLLVLLALASVAWPATKVKFSDRGGGPEENNLWLMFELPSGQELERTDAFFAQVESFLQERRDRYRIDALEVRFRNAFGRVQVRFRPEEAVEWYEVVAESALQALGRRERPLDRKAIEEEFRRDFPLPPGVRMRTTWRERPNEAGLTINLFGEDTTTLVTLAEEVERRLRTIPGLLSVETDLERGGSELQVVLDRERTRQLGVNPEAVSGGIAYSIRGLEVGRYHAPDGRELRIRVQLAEGDRQTLDDLRAMTFRTEGGADVPLEALADLGVTRALGQIRRDSGQTMLSVSARAPKDDMKRLAAEVDRAMQGFEMPRGYRWDKGERFVRLQESNRAQQFAMVLAVTFVFLLMGVLFESFVLPLAVIVAVPFSFFGVYWTLWLTGTEMNIMAMIGVVILIGIVVNNAIVLVDLANRLRAEGADRLTALVEAGRHRFRPILMTTFTTVGGLIPMALGKSGMIGMPYAPLGRTMIGGLLASAALTLVIVPLFYTLLDDLREKAAAIAASARRPAAAPSDKPA